MAWYVDNPMAAWGINKNGTDTNTKSPLALALGYLPDQVKTRLVEMGYDHDVMNSTMMKRITNIIPR
jgi:hypothetical protein